VDKDDDNGKDDIAWGRAASAADRRAVTSVVKSYYAAAAAGDAVRACSLMYSIFAEEIPEEYGESPPGPPGLHGTTCAAVLAKLFKQQHRRLVADLATLEVTRVRLKGRRGLAILHFRTAAHREIPVHRERRAWKIDALLDGGFG
jgi:hypothetical protein